MSHAIIGCGRVSGNHVYAARAANVEVEYCFDLDPSKSSVLAASASIKKEASSVTEILNDQTVTSVSICTDHGSHAALTVEALSAGKHVVVEKPMATCIVDAKAMLKAARETGKKLAVISQHRYNPVVRQLRSNIQAGIFGSIAMGVASLECKKSDSYYRDSSWRGTKAREGGSTLINQFIHTLDLLIWIFGPPKRVFGSTGSMKFGDFIETEDTFSGCLEFGGGPMVTLASTNCSTAHWNSQITLVGSAGTVRFSTGHPVKIEAYSSLHKDSALVSSALQEAEIEAESRTPPTMSYYGTSHAEQFVDFFQSIKTGRPLQMHPRDAMRTLAVVRALYQSAEQGRSINFLDADGED